MFSNNMLKKRTFNPNAQITCRKHTSGAVAVTELLCSSCQKHKAIDFFSNNERKASGGQRCRACVEWVESDEPNHIPLPAPNSVRDDHEKQVYKGYPMSSAAYQSDEDDDYVTEAQAVDSDASWVGRSRETTGAEIGDGLTQKNLQQVTGAGNPSAMSSRGSYHPSSAPTDTASTTGSEDTARPHDASRFTAYGPNGQVQRRQAGTASSVTSATSRSTTAGKAWARPAGRKYAPALPRHMEYENPETVGYCDYDDDDSSDGC